MNALHMEHGWDIIGQYVDGEPGDSYYAVLLRNQKGEFMISETFESSNLTDKSSVSKERALEWIFTLDLAGKSACGLAMIFGPDMIIDATSRYIGEKEGLEVKLLLEYPDFVVSSKTWNVLDDYVNYNYCSLAFQEGASAGTRNMSSEELAKKVNDQFCKSLQPFINKEVGLTPEPRRSELSSTLTRICFLSVDQTKAMDAFKQGQLVGRKTDQAKILTTLNGWKKKFRNSISAVLMNINQNVKGEELKSKQLTEQTLTSITHQTNKKENGLGLPF